MRWNRHYACCHFDQIFIRFFQWRRLYCIEKSGIVVGPKYRYTVQHYLGIAWWILCGFLDVSLCMKYLFTFSFVSHVIRLWSVVFFSSIPPTLLSFSPHFPLQTPPPGCPLAAWAVGQDWALASAVTWKWPVMTKWCWSSTAPCIKLLTFTTTQWPSQRQLSPRGGGCERSFNKPPPRRTPLTMAPGPLVRPTAMQKRWDSSSEPSVLYVVLYVFSLSNIYLKIPVYCRFHHFWCTTLWIRLSC